MMTRRILGALGALGLVALPATALAQDSPAYECDDKYGQCGTPEQSGGGCGCGGGGSILINNTDLGDTYQYADDYDDDGIEDPFDNCPRVSNIDQADGDGDGFGDGCDNCISQANPDQLNLDADAFGNVCDDDMDGDEILNTVDNCPMVPNAIKGDIGAQADLDGDGLGDACDPDIDGDGLDNLADACPLDADPNATGDDCFPDTDGDGVGDFDAVNPDLCPTVADSTNSDIDGDGIGDVCDPDMDDDGFANTIDNCMGVANADQTDADRDGLGDTCDTKFCFVVLGDADNCLDPTGTLTAYVPNMLAQTGEELRVRLFANRINQAMNYSWSIIDRPAGSKARLNNPEGITTISTPYEYHYLGDKVATFEPDLPGVYTVRVDVETVWEDRVSGKVNATAFYEATIEVTGDPVTLPAKDTGEADTGCSGGSSTQTGVLFGLLALLGLAVIRRRTA